MDLFSARLQQRNARSTRGTLLRLGKSGANVVLSWGTSCSDAANDYSVHRGTIGSWYSHQALACTTGGVTSTTLAPGAASSYFLNSTPELVGGLP